MGDKSLPFDPAPSRVVPSLDGPRDADAEDAWVAEIEHRARRVLADAGGGDEWSAARAEIESTLRPP